MKQKRKEAQICYLTEGEMNDPCGIIRGFTEDLSLEAARKLIVTMREICSTTENVIFGDAKVREELFYVTDKIIRLFEACYVHQRRIRFEMHGEGAQARQLKVLEKHVLKNVTGAPNTVPYIPLFGRWLALANFNPGTAIAVVAEKEKIFITTSKAWGEKANEARMRA